MLLIAKVIIFQSFSQGRESGSKENEERKRNKDRKKCKFSSKEEEFTITKKGTTNNNKDNRVTSPLSLTNVQNDPDPVCAAIHRCMVAAEHQSPIAIDT